MKNIKKVIFSLLLIALTAVVINPLDIFVNSTDTSEKMEVHFIDVGQGDATLIKCSNQIMLIDTGDDSKGTAIQSYLQKQGIEKLDYLVLTHPDADHIGGAPVIITKFDIDKVFVSNFEKDNKTYQKLIQSLDNKRLKYATPEVGSTYTLGTGSITFLAPNKDYDNPNDASIALMVENGSNKFLFTGDAEEFAENDIIKNGLDIKADVYKVGHHGSKTSTSEDFFKKVNPSHAVISCGEDNSYGHPHAETLNTLRMNDTKVYRTDEDGTIVVTSDGKEITFNIPPSETWKSGEATGSAQSSNGTNLHIEETVLEAQSDTKELLYILNTNTKKFHKPTCSSLPITNQKDSSESRDSLISDGYDACKRCNP